MPIRQIATFLSTVLCATMALCACQKSDTEPVVVPTPVNTMSATVSGKSFSTNELSGALGASSIQVSGAVNSGTSKATTISLSIPHYQTLTTYAIDTATSAGYSDVSGLYTANSGSITITAFNEVHVAGTFAFEATSPGGAVKSVTGGSFDAYR